MRARRLASVPCVSSTMSSHSASTSLVPRRRCVNEVGCREQGGVGRGAVPF